MSHTTDAHALLERLDSAKPTNTEIRSIAQKQGRNHELATQLWKHGGFTSRMLSLLILDLKAVDLSYIEMLISDIENADGKEQSQLCDWMIANVIMKKAALKKETTKWRSARSTIKQRVFCAPTRIDEDIQFGTVQWNLNWCAAQIGIADESLRERCIALGERLGLYKDYAVSKGCTSPYLPTWIGSVVRKKGGG